MAAIIIPSRWQRQPQGTMRIDRSNALAAGARLLFSLGSFEGLTDACGSSTRAILQQAGAASRPSFSGGPSGAGLRTASGNGDGNISWARVAKDAYVGNSLGSSGTVAAFVNIRTLNTRVPLIVATQSGVTSGLLFDVTNDPGTRLIAGDVYAQASSAPAVGKDALISASWDGSTAQIYIDGRQIVSAASNAPNFASVSYLDIGSRAEFGIDYALDGLFYLAGVWNIARGEAFHRELAKNPFQLFAPINRRIYFDLGAGGALTVTAGGIATSETFGTSRLDRSVSITGIGSVEAFGGARLDKGIVLEVGSGGIASAEGFGLTQLYDVPTADISWTGIASAEAFGTAQLDYRLALTGAASDEAFGTATVNLDAGQSITITGIGSAEGFGTAGLQQSGVIATSAIASAEAFGTAQLDFRLVADATASAEAFGTTQVALDTSQTVSAVGDITTAEAFGTEQLDFTLVLTGLASAGAFGGLVVQGGVQDAFGDTRPGSSLSATTRRIGTETLVPSNDGKIG